MEATGVYWVPVWNVLEREGLHRLLINPEDYKAVRGKKTDLKDGERIAELLQDGRLEGSYVPRAELRVLRDLTRYRVKLVKHQSSVACRIQKLLEQCNIKLGSVASNVLGVSGTAMLHALVSGETDPARLADLAKKQLRRKIPALRLALDGCLMPHHRFLLRDMLEELSHIETQLARLEAEIELQMRPFQRALHAWMSIPGVKHRVAWTLVAEIGTEMQVFPSSADIASWVGVCPGNNESAGKRKSGKTRKGNRWARRALCEAAPALIVSRPAQRSLTLRPACSPSRLSDPLHRRLRRLRFLCRRSDCYRVERTSSRAGLSPTVNQHLSRRTCNRDLSPTFRQSDGGSPENGLARDKDGNLYGTTYQGGDMQCSNGGSYGCGVVFKLEPNGNFTVLHSFTGGADGIFPNDLLLDAAGNLYGTTPEYGITHRIIGSGVVFKLTP